MVKLEVIDDAMQQVIVRADRPIRIEASVDNGKLLLYVYDGAETDLLQEPLGVFDGTNDINADWEA